MSEADVAAPVTARTNQPKPHRVVALVDRWGEVRLDIVCPYTRGEKRPCKLGVEVRCDWYDYEVKGSHHDSCPTSKNRDAPCSAPEGSETCWPTVPEECDGWDHYEIGHVHETNGCWVQEIIGEMGWGEAIRWHRRHDEELTVPLEVFVEGDDDQGVTLMPWSEVNR